MPAYGVVPSLREARTLLQKDGQVHIVKVAALYNDYWKLLARDSTWGFLQKPSPAT